MTKQQTQEKLERRVLKRNIKKIRDISKEIEKLYPGYESYGDVGHICRTLISISLLNKEPPYFDLISANMYLEIIGRYSKFAGSELNKRLDDEKLEGSPDALLWSKYGWYCTNAVLDFLAKKDDLREKFDNRKEVDEWRNQK